MIHFVYPYNENKIEAPWSIGNHVGKILTENHYEIKQYDWKEKKDLQLSTNDVLFGHPTPEGDCIFDQNLDKCTSYSIFPYNGIDDEWVDRVISKCTHSFLICGPYWAKKAVKKWKDKITCLDMAIDRKDYPQIKTEFNPPGHRRILYIGCCNPEKGVNYLAELTLRMPDIYIGHMGYGLIAGTWNWYYRDFRRDFDRSVLSGFDFIINPGINDANPTTILEGASWGLLPICTPTSGWGNDIAYHITGNVDADIQKLRQLLSQSDEECKLRQKICMEKSHYYNWHNFTQPILEKLSE